MKKILVLIGTRPNFIKVTQFKRAAMEQGNLDLRIIHSGQHYDHKMSGVFFEQFGLSPDHILDIPKGGSPNAQIANIIKGLDEYMESEFLPDLMVVVGDVNSTLAGAITANKRNIKIAHVESGLRSNDRGMPEEINRILTDEITDLYFITEQSGYFNLKADGKEEEQLAFVGNTMIDTLVAFEPEIEACNILDEVGTSLGNYVMMTMHRPATVDFEEGLLALLEIVEFITAKTKLVFPIHPRTKKNFEKFGLFDRLMKCDNLVLMGPIGYFQFQRLVRDCKYVVTDSGGIQEETTFRQVPCLTLRPNTERPSTVDIGTNTLLDLDVEVLKAYIEEIENGTYKKGEIPRMWDGKSSERIMEYIAKLVGVSIQKEVLENK